MINITLDELIDFLSLKRCNHYIDDISELLKEAESIATPVCECIEINENTIQNEYIKKIFKNSNKAYAYIASCGNELESFAHSKTDYFSNYVANAICNLYFNKTTKLLFEKLSESHQNIFCVHPGTIKEYTLNELSDLFEILDQSIKKANIELTANYIVKPYHTICGMIFDCKTPCFDCRFCYKQDCVKRKFSYLDSGD